MKGSAGEHRTSRARRRDSRERVGTGDRASGASGGGTANPAPRLGAAGEEKTLFQDRDRSRAARGRCVAPGSARARSLRRGSGREPYARVRSSTGEWSCGPARTTPSRGGKISKLAHPRRTPRESSPLQRHATRDAGASKWTPGGKIFRGKAPRCGDAILYVVCSLGKVLTRWSTDE